jgi:hypothetical protein
MRKAEAVVRTEEGLMHVLQLACMQVVHTAGLTHAAACCVVQPEAVETDDEQLLYVVVAPALQVQHVSKS